jgi:peptide/nickel transport system substrate-binding protein
MKKKIVWLIVSCLMVAVLVLASCGPQATTTPPLTTAPPITTPPTTTPKPTGEPQYGGTLTILFTVGYLEPQTWDPAQVNWIVDPWTSPYMEKLFIGDFVKYGPRGTNQFPFTDMEFVPFEFRSPWLAESVEQPDPLTIVYHIRKGIMFANKPGVMASREMTANDVAFALDRLIKHPLAIAQGYYKYIDSVTASDKYTVVVKMKQYDYDWTLPLSWGYYTEIYPPEVVNAPNGGIANWRNANGTGPFILKDYVSGASVTYEKNPVYWGTTKIGGKDYKIPFADKLQWPIIVDESTRLAAIRTGKVDINEGVSNKYKQSLQDTNPDLARFRILNTSVGNIAMKTDTKPFDDIRVRRAMNMAIDRKAILGAINLGEGETCNFPFSKEWGESLYTPLDKLPASAQELFKYDPAKAKQLMTDAGYPNGFTSELVVSSTGGTTMLDSAAMLVDMWDKNLGVKVNLKVADYATYLAIQYGQAHKGMLFMSKGNGDPFAVLLVVGPPPGQYWNPSRYDDPVFADLFTKARQATTREAAYKLLKEANVRWIDQAPTVIMDSGYYYAYAWPWVKNWYGEVNSNTRQPGLIHATIWLDRDLREKTIGKK